MSIDEKLRQGGSAVRRDAERLAGAMSPPAPSSSSGRRGASIGMIAVTAALVVAGLAVLVTARDDPAPSSDTSPTSPFAPILDRPGYFRYDSAQMEFWLPSSGWYATTETLTPNIGELDGVAAYRDADTILSLSTKPFTDTEFADTTNCLATPFAALADLAPTDALVSVVETSAGDLPERRRATGIYDGRPERLYPYIGEVNEDWCLDQVRRRGDADLFYRQYIFTDAGRSFTVHVALGSATTTLERHDAWRILDRLAFDQSAPPTSN